MPPDVKFYNYSILCLSQIPGIGPQRIRNLFARFKNPEEIFRASFRDLVAVEGIDKTLAMNIKQYQKNDFAVQQIERAKRYGVEIVNFWDAGYPALLKNIHNPPVLLFVRGSIPAMSTRCIAIVGTRNPSPYGKLQAEKFSRELALNGVTVVSGLARGVDTIAHKIALSNGGQTLAVLGSGIDTIYPEENRPLAEQIATCGAVISEFPMTTKPDAMNFPRRNRIIAGLSSGTLVVEAGSKSGALITADFAVEQGREVFAVPGNINNPKSFGCNNLIQQGAKLVQCLEDIFDEVGMKKVLPGESDRSRIPLTSQERIVMSFLTNEVQHIDIIASQCQLPTSLVLSVLLSLELKNVVRQFPGKNFMRF